MNDKAYASHRRAASAAGVAVLHAAALWLVLARPPIEVQVPSEAIVTFAVPPPAPAPLERADAKTKRAPRREGAASAANRRAKPSPMVAPPPKVRVEVPPPVVAAPVAGPGVEASAGASSLPGPGTGSGGVGSGLGSGLAGTGTGGGGGTGARWIKGRIRDSDYPRAASRAEVGGTVIAHFDVGTDGRAGNCRVVSSSGNSDLDATTCRLIVKRFRYKPATNAQGDAVPDVAGWKQTWWLEPRDRSTTAPTR